MITLRRGACVLATVLVACAPGAGEVPLTVLAEEQDSYDGRAVSTSGSVIAIQDSPGGPAYFVLEDNGSRVRLLPDASAAPYSEESVVVTGTFRFDPNAGRELHVETIERSP